MKQEPLLTLRTALEALLDGATFNYEAGNTRKLIRQGQKALQTTMPAAAHERPVGIYRYDPGFNAMVPVREQEAIDKSGNLKPGYEYLFRQPRELVAS